MQVTRLTSEHQQKQYEQFVAAHKSGSFLQSWSWGEFQTIQGKGAIRYGIYDEVDGAQQLIGTAQFLLTKVPHLPGSYLYAAYGPLFNSGRENDAVKLIEQVKIDFPKIWFIRVEPKDELPIQGKPTLHIQPGSTLISDLLLSEDELQAAMHQKTRYNIKVAAKHGVTVITAPVSEPKAVDLLAKTSERQGYRSHPAEYYERLINYFTGKDTDSKVRLYQAVYDEESIAVAIMIDHGYTRTYLFGGSENSQRQLMAPYALHWQAMRDAKQNGLTKYDWWGAETASGATPGFVQFKLKWGGVQKFYANSCDIVMNSPWYHAYTALRKVNRFI